ncbi:DUF2207 family protein [Actinokineospora fastidiosa]|uniref:Predicted membrane protein YciQ-like C-terminal domain-containing protein n=1 Tax=Actinokineospora fastidiosa TaxID=1816 RepID=A0A918G226_9PSEU|nr:DUF2207 domain-containing protein [Actinokineospora fastidiosa]GGS12718.1 hypothetical protein GCM10010171_00470 [Actinokineospora fastidiosa]
MLTKWGIAAGLVVAGITIAGQPTFSPPPNAPTFDFPLPTPGQPTGGPIIVPRPPTGEVRPTRPPGVPVVLPRSVNIQLKLERDGSVSVVEQVIVQAKSTMTRTAPLRVGDRVFTVSDPKVDGNGTASVTGDQLVIKLGEGASTVSYKLDGAIADLGDRLQFRWQVASGWDTKLVFLRASLLTPKPGYDFVCLAGAPNTEERCDSAVTDAAGILRVLHSDLDTGARVDVTATLDAGLVPATAKFDSGVAGTGPFALTPLSGGGLGLVLLLLIGGFAVVLTARGRDTRALAAEGAPVDVLVGQGERVVFASPDGILPGQAGTVIDERVDPRDLTATVVDLAVRNYLWITEAGPDWQIVRRNAPDDALTAYERAVYDALLPEGTDAVTVSALRSTPPRVAGAQSAVYADAVSRSWLSRRPGGLGKVGIIGAAVAVVGAAVTVALALSGGPALLGVAVVIGGIGLLLGARLLPARTKRGGLLLQQVRGLHGYLRAARPDRVPVADREMVFSRSLPYAVALDETKQWLERNAQTMSAGLYWYAAQEPRFDPRRFADRFPALVDELDAVFGKR